MKRRLFSLACVLALVSAGAPSAQADPGDNEVAVLADVVVVRPVCFVATVVGSALFVVSLPVTSLTRSVHKTGHALVVRPAKATFTRPIGDMDALKD